MKRFCQAAEQTRLVTVLAVTILCGCATSYQKLDFFDEGFSESRIDQNSFLVSFKGNYLTSRQTVESYMLRRSAELTLQAGFDYFVVASSNTQATNQSTVGGIGPLILTPTTTSIYLPTSAYTYSNQEARATIKVFKGEKPAGSVNAYDARDVLKFLAPAERNDRVLRNSSPSDDIKKVDQQTKLEPDRPATDKATVPQQTRVEKSTAPVRLSALLTHTKGRSISSPPMTLDAEYFDNGSGAGTSRLIFPGNQILEGEFKLLPLQASFKGIVSPRLLDPDKFLPPKNAAQRGFATYSNQTGTVMECAFSVSDSGRIDQGRCLDNRGNEYRISY